MRMVAFPRGINVGGRVVPMSQLRTLLEGAEFTNVRTVLASGNVAFDAPHDMITGGDDGVATVRARIEGLMSTRFGYEAIVQVFTAEAVGRCLEDAPWDAAHAVEHRYIVFTDDDGVRARLLEAGADLARSGQRPPSSGSTGESSRARRSSPTSGSCSRARRSSATSRPESSTRCASSSTECRWSVAA